MPSFSDGPPDSCSDHRDGIVQDVELDPDAVKVALQIFIETLRVFLVNIIGWGSRNLKKLSMVAGSFR